MNKFEKEFIKNSESLRLQLENNFKKLYLYELEHYSKVIANLLGVKKVKLLPEYPRGHLNNLNMFHSVMTTFNNDLKNRFMDVKAVSYCRYRYSELITSFHQKMKEILDERFKKGSFCIYKGEYTDEPSKLRRTIARNLLKELKASSKVTYIFDTETGNYYFKLKSSKEDKAWMNLKNKLREKLNESKATK